MAKDLINIAILGSTGSIGTQALEIIKFFPEKFNVLALANKSNPEIIEQIKQFKPKYVSTKSKINADSLSAFGGIIAINQPCDDILAKEISKVFVEIVLAPAFTKKSLEIFSKN